MDGLQTFAEIRLNPVVVDERIVDVEQKDGAVRSAHRDVPPLATATSLTIDGERLPEARKQRALAALVKRAALISNEPARSAQG